MRASGPILGFVSLVLIAGAILLILLTLLGGAVDHNPTNKFYFIEVATQGIPGAASTTRWTFWNACSVLNGGNSCPAVHPAYPFDPQSNFAGTTDVPPAFLGTSKFYYLTRFMFAFVLIGLFFAVCSLFLGLAALCSRIGSFLSGALCSVALFFQSLTAALMTAAYVIGRNDFRSNNMTANLGKYNFGFMWAAAASLLIATVLFCAGGAADRSGSRGSGGGRFGGGRKKSTRSNRNRGSFIDSE